MELGLKGKVAIVDGTIARGLDGPVLWSWPVKGPGLPFVAGTGRHWNGRRQK